jgi:hypothetical protein
VARGLGRANVGSLPYHILAARTDTNSGHPRWGEHANVVLGHEPTAVTTLRHEGKFLATQRIDVPLTCPADAKEDRDERPKDTLSRRAEMRSMTDPVNLNIPGFDYLFFALLFAAVVALLTLGLARGELALRRKRQALATEASALLESRRIEGSLEWIEIQGQNAWDRARDRRPQQRSQDEPNDLIDEAED